AIGSLGCVLQPGDIAIFGSHTSFHAITDRLISTTGDKDFDRALGRALVRLSALFGERPGFGFVDDSGAPNAYASRETKVSGTWGTVLFGQTLFHELLNRHDDRGIAVLAVAAHEFGHIAQFRSGADQRL